MTYRLLLTLCCVTLFNVATAQDTDKKLVEKTVSYYLDGGTNNDFDTLKKAFHENATMKFISNEGYKEVNALEAFRKGMKPGPKQDRQTSIEAIDVSGMAASAKLKIESQYGTYIDYMNLLKVDGEWKIVSKIYSKK